jgi:hypothetical protein
MKFAALITLFILLTISLALAVDRGSTSDTQAPEGTFPALSASNLEGETLRLPGDFAGDRNLLLIAFQREQQKNVDTWLHEMTRFQLSPGFHYYELPTIDKMNPFVRWFINNGMRRGIPDHNARSRTITLYLNKPAFLKALSLPDEKRIYAILVDRSGRVLWRAEGDFDEAKASSLQKVLAGGKSGGK